MCDRFHQRAVLSHGNAAVITELACNCWACKDCSQRLKRTWLARFRDFSRTDNAFQVTDVTTLLDKESLHARLRRNERSYVTVRTSTGWRVFHQAFRGNRQTRAMPRDWITPNTMLRLAEESLAAIQHQRRQIPVTASNGVPRQESWRKNNPWKLVTKTSVTVREMNRRLQLTHMAVEIFAGRRFPRDWLLPIAGDGLQLSVPFSSDNYSGDSVRVAPTTRGDWWAKEALPACQSG